MKLFKLVLIIKYFFSDEVVFSYEIAKIEQKHLDQSALALSPWRLLPSTMVQNELLQQEPVSVFFNAWTWVSSEKTYDS